jgi:hypothetical protein
MHRSLLVMVAATGLSLALVSAVAAQGRGMGHGGGGAAFGAANPPTWQGSNPPGFSRGKKVGWHGAGVPPGWAKAQKKAKGWRGGSVPPGLQGR